MGVPPKPPGHWSEDCPGFTRRPPDQIADYAAALDDLAAAAGVDDGLVLLQKEFGITAAQAQSAGRAQATSWFLTCYARHATTPAAGTGGDAVFHGYGIWELDAGWDPRSRVTGC